MLTKNLELSSGDSHRHNVNNKQNSLVLDSSDVVSDDTSKINNTSVTLEHNQEMDRTVDMEGSEGIPSLCGRVQADLRCTGDLQRSQTIGPKITGNIFVRSLASKSENRTSAMFTPSSPSKFPDTIEPKGNR